MRSFFKVKLHWLIITCKRSFSALKRILSAAVPIIFETNLMEEGLTLLWRHFNENIRWFLQNAILLPVFSAFLNKLRTSRPCWLRILEWRFWLVSCISIRVELPSKILGLETSRRFDFIAKPFSSGAQRSWAGRPGGNDVISHMTEVTWLQRLML